MPADLHAPERAAATLEAIKRFDAAFGRHDVDAIMAAMTDDCVFESTYPPPDGRRFEGQAAVRGAWEELFRASPDAHFETEDLFVADDRCTARWIYHYSGADGSSQHIRGVDVFRVRDGKVAEKLAYVKG
jgi:ketosteroid isomerase-like protein